MTLAFVNPGDEVISSRIRAIPPTPHQQDSGYRDCDLLDLREDNGWQPDFDELEKMDLSHVKLMWTNYPNMPTGGVAKRETL